MLALAREMRHDIGDRQTLTGRIRLGAADTVALTWLPRFLSRVDALYPKLEIELEIDLTIHLMRRLAAREIDLAFIAAPVSESDYIQAPLCSYPLHWTAGSEFPLRAGPLTPAQLAGFTVITHTRGSHQHETVLKWFHAAGAEPRRMSTSSSLASIIRLTAAGLGISLQTPAVIARECAAGELLIIPTTVPVPDLHFYSAHRRSGAPDAARALSELAAAEAKLQHAEKRIEIDQFL
jgi:DNA-binding transcriptional LysR family regulator